MIEQITELQAIAQSGLAFCKDKFDISRYERLLEIAASLLASNSNHKYDEILELFKKDVGYATPKIDVRAAIFKDDQILLVQEKSDNLWALPGGWADVNLSPSENVLKEIKEETGFSCKIIKLIGVLDRRKDNSKTKKWPHVYKLFFFCEIISSEQSVLDENEILQVNFFDYKNIPELSTGRTNIDQINTCFRHFRDQLLYPEFD